MKHRITSTCRNATLLLISSIILVMSGSVFAQEGHVHETEGDHDRTESEHQSSIALDPAAGSEIGVVYEAYLSPQQEGGEEEETPALIPPQFRSTTPSVPRNERTSQGHAVIEFTNDLSRAYVSLAIENVNIDDIVMLHLHCGRPAQLGPILLDFSLIGSINSYLEDGVFVLEVTNEDIVATTNTSNSLIDAFTIGCAIDSSNPSEKVRTIAGMEQVARRGELYFNLHTSGQVYFGDMRGQFYLSN